MSLSQVIRIAIAHSSDVYVARTKAGGLATQMGFGKKNVEEITIVASELATNMLVHAGKGMLILTALANEEQGGIQIEAVDSGPGFSDWEKAVTDGYSTSDSMGYGLGTANRLMDELEIMKESKGNRGAHIIARKWLRQTPDMGNPCPFDIGVATRAHPGMKLNGDHYVIKRDRSTVLVAVIDGVGHGQYAHRASQKAAEYIESHHHEPFENLFQGTFRNCRGTRGVVMAILRLDWKRETATFASIGNIEVKIWNRDQKIDFPLRRGIVGVNAPKPLISQHAWNPENIVVLFSDGLTSRWKWNDISHLLSRSANDMARELLYLFGKNNDDATVMVIKKHLDR
ncbi:SpoIIE family protein phosphatase [bacterium]|nr:SpoIIE family protein phosphatase [bacterium]